MEYTVTYLASDLLSLVHNSPAIVLNYDKTEVTLRPHFSYMIERLEVHTSSDDNNPNIRRILVGTTGLKEIAMHIQDCIEKSNIRTEITWNDILSDLTELVTNTQPQ